MSYIYILYSPLMLIDDADHFIHKHVDIYIISSKKIKALTCWLLYVLRVFDNKFWKLAVHI